MKELDNVATLDELLVFLTGLPMLKHDKRSRGYGKVDFMEAGHVTVQVCV